MIRGPRPPVSKWLQAQRKPSAAVQKAPPSERVGGRWRNRRRGCSTSANSTSDNSTSASWPKSKLAESEIDRNRN